MAPVSGDLHSALIFIKTLRPQGQEKLDTPADQWHNADVRT